MEIHISDSSLTTKCKVRVFMSGLMDEAMMVSGFVIKCMDLGYLNGKMVVSIQDIITMIKKKVKGFWYGQMVRDLKDNGLEVCNMALVQFLMQMVLVKRLNGVMVS